MERWGRGGGSGGEEWYDRKRERGEDSPFVALVLKGKEETCV